ncbi:hypothetical protein [Amycolatopsis sp. SID8362]|uniref:hypothetical protein n=1 Tax=Amycolatopsis sp. SID8362 TaxID=2690346 RepID=UPI001371ED06|nr:hypothetical protein [Amycolatopsis sp. SID8362]NBH09944.1 hypothetical protein [Amycolatopsis sp. SID8362]NED46637.1 hypothetical protein [Amycolatopsis sp. SID8362]
MRPAISLIENRYRGIEMRRGIVVCLFALVTAFSVAGCDHLIDLGCGDRSCHFNLTSGGKVDLGGQELQVQKVDNNSVTFLSNGISVSLFQGVDIDFLGYHLHLGEIRGGEASLDVTRN